MDEAEELRRVAAEGRLDLFSPASVAAVARLNARLLAALIDEAAEARATQRSPAARIGDLLVRIRSRARARLSEVPVSLLDAGFRIDARWQELAPAAGAPKENHSKGVGEGFFRTDRAMRLAYELFDAAVAAARSGIPNAILLFGMSPSVARVFAALEGETVLWLRDNRWQWIQPRWSGDLEEWKRFVLAARFATDEAALPSVRYRVLARHFSDLDPSATRAASAIRRSRG
jgi:hypothetical protein